MDTLTHRPHHLDQVHLEVNRPTKRLRLTSMEDHYTTTVLQSISSQKEKLQMTMRSFYIPKDDDERPLGEDAHFICQEKQIFGVADGVGGWIKRGVDAGEYARELMTNCLIALCDLPKAEVTAKMVLRDAYSITKAGGSSTACVVTLKDDCLYAANVGDSGFMQFRNNKFIYQSPVQQRGFNCPYQLGNAKNSDRPDVEQEFQVRVEPGDIIVAGTDGLLDNMFPSEIEGILSRKEDDICPKGLALRIADYALYNSFDRFSDSPFARAARKAGRQHAGGKVDDISVIVAKIEAL